MALFIFIVWHDSLEQTRNHEELESTKLSLELAEDAAQVGIWNFDIERRVVVGTLFHDQLYGRTEKVKEWTVEDIIASIHPEDRAVFTERTAAGLRDVGLSYAMEYRVIWPDSSVHWHSVMVRLKRDETGKVTHQRGITYDVTYVHETKLERELMEIREKAAVESLRLKSEFLATMSHEIRTPINGVMGMTNILLDTSLSAEQTEYAQAIKRSGQSLLVVINDILDFSKIEANKLDFEEIDFAVQQALEDAVLTVRYVAQKKNVQVNLFIDSAIPKFVAGDPGRLQQVVTNLLSNAVKFTPEGEVKVNARLLKCDEEFATVRIEVVDTGIGISESSLERLFQPFTQADNSTTRKYGGTGLGLSISKHLIERMHGEVGAASKVGEGSTFWFTARFGRATSGNELVSVKPEELIVATIPRCRILIAEDVLVNQIVAVRMVEKLGHFTHTVANGKEVLDALHNGDYDLILMDCHMPEMDGYEATTAIRASKTISNPNIIILAMTANAMKGDKEKCIAVGMNDYLSKPIEPKGLQKALSKWLLESGRSKKPA
ncbi:MAG: response regulator, partial [Proteobacteria bacterium]